MKRALQRSDAKAQLAAATGTPSLTSLSLSLPYLPLCVCVCVCVCARARARACVRVCTCARERVKRAVQSSDAKAQLAAATDIPREGLLLGMLCHRDTRNGTVIPAGTTNLTIP